MSTKADLVCPKKNNIINDTGSNKCIVKYVNCNTVLVPFLPPTLSKIKLRMTYSCCQDYNVLSILKLLAVLSCWSQLKIQCLNRNASNT